MRPSEPATIKRRLSVEMEGVNLTRAEVMEFERMLADAVEMVLPKIAGMLEPEHPGAKMNWKVNGDEWTPYTKPTGGNN